MSASTENILDIASKKLRGLQEIGPSSFNAQESGSDFSNMLWRKLISSMTEAQLPVQRAMYGLSWPADEKTPPDSVYYFVGFEEVDENVPGSFQELTLEAGKFFRHRYTGPAAEIDQAFQEAYMNSFPKSGLTPRNGQHIEAYPADLDMESGQLTFDILIPIAE